MSKLNITDLGRPTSAWQTAKASGPALTEADAARFWAKVEQRGPNECWPWLASKSGGAGEWYGQFGFGPRRQRRIEGSHRVAWILTHGPLPEGAHVLHRCDNSGCCNPAHLFLGTHTVNMQDASQKGRLSQARKRNRQNRAGAVQRYLNGEKPEALAEEYGVHYLTVLRWLRRDLGRDDLRRGWRDLRRSA